MISSPMLLFTLVVGLNSTVGNTNKHSGKKGKGMKLEG
jgi:hypothetical protein